MANPTILMLGLDNSGKTKILYTLKLGEVTDKDFREIKFEPTTAFNFEVIPWYYERQKFNLKMFDLAGRAHLRPMWKHFYHDVTPDCLIYVIEDKFDRIEESKICFQRLLHDPKLIDTIKVVLINIRDEEENVKRDNLDVEERVRSGLGLNDGHPVHSIAKKVKIFAIHLGKSQKEDKNIFNAINYICKKCLERSNSTSQQSVNVKQ